MNHLDLALKAAYPRALATLVRVLGSIDGAEDAVQEAAARAVKIWPERGVPDLPAAWLVRVGRNHAVDGFRRKAVESRHAQSLALEVESFETSPDEDRAGAPMDDDLLRLIFTCCHPILKPDDQVALTLKTLAGLSVEEIGRAYLMPAATLEKRLTRAKARLREAQVPYEVPPIEQLPARLDAVLTVVYLVFNEGYKASLGPELMRLDLCREAIRLGRMLARAFREEPEVSGLLALMLLNHSRAPARVDDTGQAVTLDEQERNLWDHALIVEGRTLVEKTLLRKQPGPYQVQAAIAALHNEAESIGQTDWRQIALLYAELERFQPSPVVTLNRAVALARWQGPAAGLALLKEIEGLPAMGGYHHFHAARASLLLDVGQTAEARRAFEKALSLAENERERDYLKKKIVGLD